MKRWLLMLLLAAPAVAWAQVREPALSDSEVEILRDRAPDAPARVLAFITFLDDRTRAIEKLATGRRKPGREEDLHDMMEQFSSIANDFEDNLDDYGKRHRDIRKVLPRLLAAAERWSTALRTPADNDAYKVSRTLALEAVNDLKESANELTKEQREYFLAHPPAKDESHGNGAEHYRPPQ